MRERAIGSGILVTGAVCFAAMAILRPGEIGTVQTGVDSCAACGMTIEDARYAGARVEHTTREAGEHNPARSAAGAARMSAESGGSGKSGRAGGVGGVGGAGGVSGSAGPRLLYDDLGCMLDAEREHPGAACFVQDFQGRGWLPAANAWFVMDPKKYSTPMGSGIVAFAARPREGGLRFAEVAEKRGRFMRERYGGK